MTPWPFGALQMFGYGLVLADPPWLYEIYSEKGQAKSAQAHYECMPTDEIAALNAGRLAGRDAICLMWATFPMLPDALRVMAAWGFDYKSGASWAKRSSRNRGWAFGSGYIFRSASELLLLGTTGAPEILSKSVRNLIVAPVRGHSRKPDQVYELAEALSRGPYVELFGRQRRKGWAAWGNETDKFTFGDDTVSAPRKPAPLTPVPAPLLDLCARATA
ncbi:MT-A70 family methyltransferase [Inquilinus limosus]|uniref:MT-A70 family methyltransferase n=1 Tax=Inquilinus limosus TaxID=171674 RepID=UPI00041F81B1|nr:MT-A70 family methyltransferase [Inquilinus limosus]